MEQIKLVRKITDCAQIKFGDRVFTCGLLNEKYKESWRIRTQSLVETSVRCLRSSHFEDGFHTVMTAEHLIGVCTSDWLSVLDEFLLCSTT